MGRLEVANYPVGAAVAVPERGESPVGLLAPLTASAVEAAERAAVAAGLARVAGIGQAIWSARSVD